MDVEMAFTYAGDPDKVVAFQRALQALLEPYGTVWHDGHALRKLDRSFFLSPSLCSVR